MAALRQYAVSVVCAAMICGILTQILRNGTVKLAVKFLCGIVMMITILNPILNVNIPDCRNILQPYTDLAQASAEEGILLAQEELSTLIKTETQAYILDKATSLGLTIDVEVILSKDPLPIPDTVYLSGKASPYTKQALADFLYQDLGITKEHQIWTG